MIDGWPVKCKVTCNRHVNGIILLRMKLLKKGKISCFIKYLKSIITNLTILLVVIFLFLLFCEGGARLLWSQPASQDLSSRIEGYAVEKPSNIKRILVLGDSVAWGWGVKREETFSKQLEGLLNHDLPQKRYEVINAGVSNTNTTHQLNVLKNKGAVPVYPSVMKGVGMAYKPDLVLVSYVLNDTHHTFVKHDQTHDALLLGNLQFNMGPYAIPLPFKIDYFLSKNSRFYKFFMVRYDRLLNRLGMRQALKEILAAYNEDSSGWLSVRRSLFIMSNITKRSNVKIVMFIWPSLVKDMKEKYAFKNVHQKIRTFASQYEIPAYDLLKTFEDFNGEKFHVAIGDAHPNAEGHQMAAQAMYDFITDNNLLPQI